MVIKKKERLMPLEMQKKLKEFIFENDLNLKDISEMIKFNRSNLNMVVNRKENLTERLEYKLKKLLNKSENTEEKTSKH